VNLGKINKVTISLSLSLLSLTHTLSPLRIVIVLVKAKAHLNVFAVVESAAKPALAAKKVQL
jgi:hypothetical protein